MQSKFNAMEKDDQELAAAVAAGTAEAPLPQGLCDRAIKNLHHMLRAQGPLSGDTDDIESWTLRNVKDVREKRKKKEVLPLSSSLRVH